jgi:hypothetical protein
MCRIHLSTQAKEKPRPSGVSSGARKLKLSGGAKESIGDDGGKHAGAAAERARVSGVTRAARERNAVAGGDVVAQGMSSSSGTPITRIDDGRWASGSRT